MTIDTPKKEEELQPAPDPVTETTGGESFSLTEPSPWVRAWLVRNLPLRRLLPDKEPAYVSSLLYTMGVLTLGAFIVTVASGVVLAVGGVQCGTPAHSAGS